MVAILRKTKESSYTLKKKQRKLIFSVMKRAYFGVRVRDQDKQRAALIGCKACMGREPKKHHNDCYFCITKIKGTIKTSEGNRRAPSQSQQGGLSHTQMKFSFLRLTIYHNLQKALMKVLVMLMQQCIVAVKFRGCSSYTATI